MKQNSKNILLNDLAARLPYGVTVQVNDDGCIMTCRLDAQTLEFIEDWDIKPYLRPMSSMTEEEEIEYQNIVQNDGNWVNLLSQNLMDFFNRCHFDYRGLIEKGLALEAPEDMYNTK